MGQIRYSVALGLTGVVCLLLFSQIYYNESDHDQSTRNRSPSIGERREDAWWNNLHNTFVKEEDSHPDVILYGDSITESWRGTQAGNSDTWAKDNLIVFNDLFSPSKQTFTTAAFGISGDQTHHLLWRLNNGELKTSNTHAPRVVTLLIGTNDLGFARRSVDSTDDITSTLLQSVPSITKNVLEIIHLIHKLSPSTQILLIGLLPRSSRTDFQQPSVFSSAIEEVNLHYQAYSVQDGRVHYIDCTEYFLSSDKKMLNRELMPDGLHPNGDGARVLGECILPTIQSLLIQQHDGST